MATFLGNIWKNWATFYSVIWSHSFQKSDSQKISNLQMRWQIYPKVSIKSRINLATYYGLLLYESSLPNWKKKLDQSIVKAESKFHWYSGLAFRGFTVGRPRLHPIWLIWIADPKKLTKGASDQWRDNECLSSRQICVTESGKWQHNLCDKKCLPSIDDDHDVVVLH